MRYDALHVCSLHPHSSVVERFVWTTAPTIEFRSTNLILLPILLIPRQNSLSNPPISPFRWFRPLRMRAADRNLVGSGTSCHPVGSFLAPAPPLLLALPRSPASNRPKRQLLPQRVIANAHTNAHTARRARPPLLDAIATRRTRVCTLCLSGTPKMATRRGEVLATRPSLESGAHDQRSESTHERRPTLLEALRS